LRQIGQRATGRGREGGPAAKSGAAPSRLVSWCRRRLRSIDRWDFRVPAHAGLKGTALLFAATAIAGIVSAGRVEEVVGDISQATGLAIDNIRITGQMETSEVAVLDKLALPPNAALPLVDLDAARERIEQLPWVQNASLRKIYPATLKIVIDERRPYALWQHDQTLSVIDEQGRIVGEAGGSHRDLVRVVGKGAELRAGEALALAAAVPAVHDQLKAAVLVNERRWDLVLDNGVTLMLPEHEAEAALKRIGAYDANNGLLSKDIVVVDMRLDDRMFVRLSPDAAARRLAAIKEQEKLAKRRGAST